MDTKKKKSMSVFFDTEFTKLRRTLGDEPKLISLGCASADGQEFYAELSDTYDISDCSDFVKETVLPLLGAERIKEADLAVQLKAWVESLDAEEVIFRCDAPNYDWPLVAYLFQFYGWPANLRRKCGTIYFDHDRQIHRYQAALLMFWKDNHQAREHHALDDARCLRFAWKFAIRRGI